MKKIIQLVQNINGVDEKVYPMTTVDAIIGLDGPIDPSNPSLEGYATEQWTEERIDELSQYIYQDIDSLSGDIKKLKSETILKFSGVLYNESEANGKAIGDIYYVKSKDYFIEVIEGGTKIADNLYHKSFNDGMSFKGNEDKLYHLGGDLYRLTNNNMVKYALVSELITGEGGNIDLSGYLTKIEAEQSYQPKGNYINSNEFAILKSQVNTATELNATQSNQITTLQNNKQNKLTSGKGINIVGDIISCTLDTSLYKIVETLPQTGEENKIYLMASNVPGEQSIYTEYAYVDGTWETIGEYTASIDLEEYAKKTEIPKNVSELNNDAEYITKNDINTSNLVTNERFEELENIVIEESDKLADIYNKSIKFYTLHLDSETGIFSEHVLNEIKRSSYISLEYNSSNWTLIQKVNSEDVTYLSFYQNTLNCDKELFMTIEKDGSYTTYQQEERYDKYNEIFVFDWDGKESGEINIQDWKPMVDSKQIVIKQGANTYIPQIVTKASSQGIISSIICVHNSSLTPSSNTTRKWIFGGSVPTYVYQESSLEVPSKLSQLINDTEFITKNDIHSFYNFQFSPQGGVVSEEEYNLIFNSDVLMLSYSGIIAYPVLRQEGIVSALWPYTDDTEVTHDQFNITFVKNDTEYIYTVDQIYNSQKDICKLLTPVFNIGSDLPVLKNVWDDAFKATFIAFKCVNENMIITGPINKTNTSITVVGFNPSALESGRFIIVKLILNKNGENYTYSLTPININIPTSTSQLTNDSEFITIKDVPTKLSQLNTDTGFITSEDILKGVNITENNVDVKVGHWVPSVNNGLTGETVHSANGTWIRIGKVVILNFIVRYQTDSTAAEFKITNLPFKPAFINPWRAGSGYIQGYVQQKTHSFAGWLVSPDGSIHARGFSYSSGAMEKLKVGAVGVDGWVDATGIIMYDIADQDLPIKSINHRGYSSEAPENTIPAYEMSAEKGYKYVECDVAFTRDDVAVLLHDDTIDRTSNGTGRIENWLYADLLKLDFGYPTKFGNKYKGTKIPTMDEFLYLCKTKGIHPYIEFKSGGGYTQKQIQKVVDLVIANNMQDNVTYISFNLTYLQYVRDYYKTARIGYLANALNDNDFGTWKQRLSSLRTVNGKEVCNDVFFDVRHDLVPDVIDYCITNYFPIEIWTVNDPEIIKSMNPYISGVTSDNLVVDDVLNLDGSFDAPDLDDEKLIYYIPRSGFTQRALTSASPYQSEQSTSEVASKRLSYVGPTITVPKNTKIRIEIDGRVPLNCACWQITSSGVTKYSQGNAFSTGDIIDSGWQTNGYEFTTDSDCQYLWLNVRRQDNAEITLADINWYKISRV